MVSRAIGTVLVLTGLALVASGATAFTVEIERGTDRLEAARKLTKEIGFYWIADQISEKIRASLDAFLESGHRNNEKEVRRLLDEIFRELAPLKDEMREETARIVARHFSAGEINELLGSGGGTATHKKLQEKSPVLMQQIMRYGQTWGQKLAHSVMQRFQERSAGRGFGQ